MRGDKNKLKQVLINLVKNACEAIAPGEVVTCQLKRDCNPNYIQISVHNGGTLIPAEIMPKLTQPFCSGKSEGTGLGLAIVKRIVDAHEGTMSIQSNASAGTTISFTLPAFELSPI
ncbi:MAG: ATP-binding protein [Xenococcaceae cyanobacterium MO_188.B32]|nr:ATP-binding protein [Xenococcaceae cyanobacterium MO_188.B32]